MARPCRACGRFNDDGVFAHCVNPACGMPLDLPPEPVDPGLADRIGHNALRRLVLPIGIALIIVLSAAHALTTGPGHA